MNRIVRDPLPSEMSQNRALHSLARDMYRSPRVHETRESERDAIDRLKILAKEMKESESELRTEKTVRWFLAAFNVATATVLHWFLDQKLCMPPAVAMPMTLLGNVTMYSDRITGFLETVKECQKEISERRECIAELFEAHPMSLPLLRNALVESGFDPDELEPFGLTEGLEDYIQYQDE